MNRMYTNCSASLQRFFCDNSRRDDIGESHRRPFPRGGPSYRAKKLRFLEEKKETAAFRAE